MAVTRAQRRARAKHAARNAAAVEPEAAATFVAPAEPAAGKRTRPAGVPAVRAVVIFPARRWCCPDCLAEVAAPRGRRLDGRCEPCRREAHRRPGRRARQQRGELAA